MSVLLQLSLCFMVVILLTSSQLTYDVAPKEKDASSCESAEQVSSQLAIVASQLQRAMSQQMSQFKGVAELQSGMMQQMAAISQLLTAVLQLQDAIASTETENDTITDVSRMTMTQYAQLQDGMTELKNRTSGLENRMTNLEKEAAQLQRGMADVQNGTKVLQEKVTELQCRMSQQTSDVQRDVDDEKTERKQYNETG